MLGADLGTLGVVLRRAWMARFLEQARTTRYHQQWHFEDLSSISLKSLRGLETLLCHQSDCDLALQGRRYHRLADKDQKNNNCSTISPLLGPLFSSPSRHKNNIDMLLPNCRGHQATSAIYSPTFIFPKAESNLTQMPYEQALAVRSCRPVVHFVHDLAHRGKARSYHTLKFSRNLCYLLRDDYWSTCLRKLSCQ